MARAEADRSCKGCRSEFEVTEERIDRMVAAVASRPDVCVPDDVYAERLAACASCRWLVSGHTCAACGCLVRVSALQRDKRCSRPGEAAWERYGAS
ncbi:DUF6171 family protein [Paenibacillus sp. TRM 82003]|nr:DUF6171 family protein [Paenibacillus sp. TRM 82003]